MPLYDQHLHSRHSFDSDADPAGNVRRAIDRGLAGLTFTEHFDMHPDDRPQCIYDHAAYTRTIERLRADFGHRIFIGQGIEVCYQPDHMDTILDLLDAHTFDVVILSVHYFPRGAVHGRDNWDGMDPADGTRSYLESLRDAVRFCARLHRRRGRVFDVLGHLDLVKRYTMRFFHTCNVAPHADLIDDILTACLEADLVPEINTSSLRQGLDETMPGPDTVARYAALGGTAMSLGSDAHRCEDVGAGFDTAVAMLRDAGLTSAAVFERRSRRSVPVT